MMESGGNASKRLDICRHDDLRHRLIARGHLNPTDDNIFDYGLYLLEHITIKADGKRLSDIQDMYTPQQQWGPEVDNPIL